MTMELSIVRNAREILLNIRLFVNTSEPITVNASINVNFALIDFQPLTNCVCICSVILIIGNHILINRTQKFIYPYFTIFVVVKHVLQRISLREL